MAGTITSIGVGSGLDAQGIISKLMVLQNQPVTLLQNQGAKAQFTVSEFGKLQGALSQFQTALQGINDISKYQSVSASVANTSLATVTASSSAVPGNYSLQVNQLAQAQALVAAGQASTSSAIGVGTISFSFGTTTGTVTNGQYESGTTFTSAGAAAKTVTISGSNNSLAGIASAINAANIGVNASIINDGSGNPYRLSLSSTSTGAASSMKISVNGDAALQNLLNQDPTSTTGQNLTQTTMAQNAQFNLNGLPITSSVNTVTSVISGVTLNLVSANPATPTSLTVAQSNSGATSAINAFVSAYNTIASAISTATAYDAKTKQAGPLQGQTSVLSISGQMQAILNKPVPGAPSMFSMLGQVGVSFQSNGTLSVDSTKLEAALTSNPGAVASLFASNGTTTDSLISFKGAASGAQPGAYAINVTQLATQAKTEGSATANTTITAGINDTVQVNLNGIKATVTLAAGNYTTTTLAAALQSAINTNNTFSSAGYSASVTESAGVLSLTSNLYGSKSVASIYGGNGQTDLFGSSATATAGVDVAGTINGQAATGLGQTLTGSSGNATGLGVVINGGTLGSRGVINYTAGYANELNNLMTSVLGKDGQIASATNGLNASIKSMQASVEAQMARNQLVLKNLQAEFSALDVTMTKLNGISSFLTSQLDAMSASASSR